MRGQEEHCGEHSLHATRRPGLGLPNYAISNRRMRSGRSFCTFVSETHMARQPALRFFFAALAPRFFAFSCLRCFATIFLRRLSDMVGMGQFSLS